MQLKQFARGIEAAAKILFEKVQSKILHSACVSEKVFVVARSVTARFAPAIVIGWLFGFGR